MSTSRAGRCGRHCNFFAVGCLALAGCAIISPIPDARTPADRARELEAKCRGIPDESAMPILSPQVIDAVEPAYSYVNGGPNGRDAHLRGARIHVRPLPGVSRESLARSVECHEVRVTLGTCPAGARVRANDPYVLPDRWLAIDVESEKDGFVVLARTDDLGDARQVLDRARLFAAARGRHSDPPSPAPPSPSAVLGGAGQPPPLQ